jgi:DNA repair exonuclease SbcCD nuclease subunit
LKKAVDFALDPTSQIQLVLIAGDLFETHNPPTDLVSSVRLELNRLVEAGIKVVTVPGNHDEITYHDSVYRKYSREWPGLLVTNPMPERVGEIDLRGTPCFLYSMAYTGGVTRGQELIQDFPCGKEAGIHLAIFHGALDWVAGERSLPLAARGLAAAGYDYVALGHLHQHQVKTVSNTVLVYPGMVEGKNLSDPGSGFFTVVEFGAGLPKVSKIPAAVRAYRRIKLDVTGMSEEQIATELSERKDPEAVVELILQGVFAFLPDLTTLKAELSPQFYHLEISDETNFIDLDLLHSWAEEPTLRGTFLRRMLKRMETATGPREEQVTYLALVKGIAALQRGEGHGNG